MTLISTRNSTGFALGEAHIHRYVMTTPNAYLRFWIITMMLVLVGLYTLKLKQEK